MQVGTKIWAIDPCYDGSGVNPRLTVGESYEVIFILDDEIKIKNDFGRPHYFTFDKFYKYFSLTPPKEVKEGVSDDDIKNEARNFDKSMLAGFKREHTSTEFYSTAEQAFIEGAKWMQDKLKQS